eukprot:TRINITY_DN1548_c0_g1_i1.p1 TRINITY_DN1548_c0_g1~~TRINITY_DN1548_c0_g1_i1.p1  ORF type:complete len:480 (+),score=85.73 TRINITY_DN1548_c0_g1_i1:162-1601(+)
MEGIEIYSSTITGIRIGYPKTWLVTENVGGAVVSFSTDPEDNNAPTLNVVIQDLTGQPMTLEDFTQLSMYQMQHILNSLEDVVMKDFILADSAGKSVEYSTQLQGTFIQFYQAYTLKEGYAYILTYSAPVGLHARFRSSINACVESFKVIEKKGVTSLALHEYYNASHRYKLHVPLSWKKKPFKTGGVNTTAIWEYTRKGEELPLLTLIVHIDKVPESLSLEEYSSVVKAQYRKLRFISRDAPEIIVSNATLGGLPAERSSFYSKNLLIEGQYTHIWTVKDKRAYTLTFIHKPKGGENDADLDLFSKLFERVIVSFSFTAKGYSVETSCLYENLIQKYSIRYLRDYVIKEEFTGATVSFSSPEADSESEEKFPSNVNIVVQDLTGKDMDLDQFCEVLKNQLEFVMKDSKMLDKTRCVISGVEGQKRVYQGTLSNFQIKMVQKVTVLGRKAIALSFTTEQSTFDREFRRLERLMDSFHFF